GNPEREQHAVECQGEPEPLEAAENIGDRPGQNGADSRYGDCDYKGVQRDPARKWHDEQGRQHNHSRSEQAGRLQILARDHAMAPLSVSSPVELPSPHFGIDAKAALANLAADDDALDLRGSFPDTVDPYVAIKPLHRVLAHIAAPAQDLQRLVDDLPRDLGTMKLQRAGMRVDAAAVDAAVDLPGDPVERRLRRKDADGHVRQHEFDPLEITDRPFELLPRGGIVVGDF